MRDRLKTKALQVFLSRGDGRFHAAPELIEGAASARFPRVVIDDLNLDGKPDLAVFDLGQYVVEDARGYGNPPQLFLSADGRLRPSDALSLAVSAYQRSPELHVKNAVAGDIDGDRDLDLWVESTGGDNYESHFMLNGARGRRFAVDESRIFGHDLTNRDKGELWRYEGAELADLDGDGDLDLALGQIRDSHPTHIDQSSIILENDGFGRFRRAAVLPLPDYFEGFTSVPWLTSADLDEDGLLDLVLVHQRNDGTNLRGEPFTGRFVQVLVNRGSFEFADETAAWLGNQRATAAPEQDSMARIKYVDVNGDGCEDFAMSGAGATGRAAPPVYLRSGNRFEPVSIRGLPARAFALDLNGDGRVDFAAITALVGKP